MRKPFILSESREGKSKTKVLLLETDEPHRLYIQNNRDWSQVVMFWTNSVSPSYSWDLSHLLFILSELSVFICRSVPKSWICKGELKAKRCLCLDFLGAQSCQAGAYKRKGHDAFLVLFPGLWGGRWGPRVPSAKLLYPTPPFVNIPPRPVLLSQE